MKKIATFAYAIDNNTLWVSHFRYNGIFKIDLCTENVEYMGGFTNHNSGEGTLHYCAKKCDNLLFFFPQYCNSVDGYDVSTDECFDVKIPEMEKKTGKAIIEAFVYNDTIVMIPRYKDVPMMILSQKEREIVEYVSLDKSIQCVNSDSKDLTLYACMVDNIIYFPIRNTNCIGSYDLEHKKEKIYVVDGIKNIIGNIEFDGTYMWINADNSIYKWNLDTKELNCVCDCSSEKEAWIEKFIIYNNMMICVPRWLNNIRIIKMDTLESVDIPIDTTSMHNNMSMPWRDIKGSFVWNDNLVILPLRFSETIFVDLKTFCVTYKEIILDECIPLKKRIALDEQNSDNIHEFLSYIERDVNNSSNYDNSIGNIIWDEVTDKNR